MNNPGDFYVDAAPAAPSGDVVCSTTITYELMLEYNRKGVATPAQRKMRIGIRIAAAVVFLLSLPMIIDDIARNGMSFLPTLYFCAAAVILLTMLVECVTRFVVGPRMLKKNPMLGSRVEYVFGEEAFRADSLSESAESHETVRYDKLIQVTETENLLMLFVQPRLAHVVDKRGFTQGTPDDLKRFLAARLDAKKLHFLK